MKLLKPFYKSQQQWFFVLGSLIILLAVLVRFYQLGVIPHGMTWDEAAIGYNGHAVITTRRDEWLHKIPISFQSFGDYKAPAAIYINGVFTILLGLKLWVVRLPFALAGMVTVLAFGALTYILAENHAKKWQTLLGLFLIATVPWHVHYSRVGFESGMALAFFLVGLVAAAQMIERFAQLNKYQKIGFLLVSSIAWAAALYTYHSAKIFVPLFVFWYGYQQREWVRREWRWLICGLMIGIILVLPLIYDGVFGHGATRAGVLITNQGYTAVTTIKVFAENLVAHLSPQFLVLGQTDSYRHGSGSWGVLLPMTFLFSMIALLMILFRLAHYQQMKYSLLGYGIAFVIFGLIPAALSSEAVPHSNRALFALPGFILLAIYGVDATVTWLSKKISLDISFRLLVGMTFLIESLIFMHYWHDYLNNFARVSAAEFQDGYLEAMQLATAYERGEYGQAPVDKILVSDDYGQPYIFALFVRKTSPIAYRGGSLYKYEFTNSLSGSDLLRHNTLVISTPKFNLDQHEATHLVYGSDGQVRFEVYYTGEHAN